MRPEPCPRHVIKYGQPFPQHVIAESTESARQWFVTWPDTHFSHLFWERYAWPGGYEIYYIVHDGGVLCHNCANEEVMRTIDPDFHDWYIIDSDVHWEGPPIYCDHCTREIQAAYGDPDAEDAEDSET